MILDELGKHTELNRLDGEGETFVIFPSTTADIVYMNDDGLTLDQFIPSSTSNVNNLGSPITVLEIAESVNLSQAVLNALAAS